MTVREARRGIFVDEKIRFRLNAYSEATGKSAYSIVNEILNNNLPKVEN